MILASGCPGGVTSNISNIYIKACRFTIFYKGDKAISISYTAVISLLTIITLPIVTIISMKYFMGAEAPPLNLKISENGLDYVYLLQHNSSWFRNIS